MSRQLKSTQESVLHAACAQSFAAPCIFAPDPWRKGNATREPADLVWACNNCVMLLYLDSSGSSPAKAIQHNVRQATGWLKAWRRGQTPLAGSNEFRRFAIAYSDQFHIVVLSVISGPNPVVEVHQQLAADLGVVCCATIPQSWLERLLGFGGTTFDLLHLLWGVRATAPGGWAEPQCSEVLTAYNNCCKLSARNDIVWPGEWSLARFGEVVWPFTNGRMVGGIGQSNGQAPIHTTEVRVVNDTFSDIGLADYYRFATAFRCELDSLAEFRQREQTGRNRHLVVRLADYDISLVVVWSLVGDGGAFTTKAHERWTEMRQAGTMRFGPHVLYEARSGVGGICRDERPFPSATERLLEEWDVPLSEIADGLPTTLGDNQPPPVG